MATNTFFNHVDNKSEQDFANDIVVETIQISGVDVWYVKRTKLNTDSVFGESTISKFSDYDIIEVVPTGHISFNGDGDLMSSFGIEMKDRISFTMAKTRFTEQLEMTKPRKGDLIYVPYTDMLWEIQKILEDEAFRQHGTNRAWKLNCELFVYSHEDIVTSDDESNQIDEINELSDTLDDIITDIESSEFNDISDEVDRISDQSDWDAKTPFGDLG